MQHSQINNYCNNNITRLDIDVLARICTALECTIGDWRFAGICTKKQLNELQSLCIFAHPPREACRNPNDGASGRFNKDKGTITGKGGRCNHFKNQINNNDFLYCKKLNFMILSIK